MVCCRHSRRRRPILNSSLKEGGGKASEGQQRRRARSVLVVTEIALAQVLLVGAALLAISYVRVTQINPGFNADRVLTAKIAPSRKKYPDPRSREMFYTTVLERLQALPGVESAGMVMNLPLTGSSMNRGFRAEGQPEPKPDQERDDGLSGRQPRLLRCPGNSNPSVDVGSPTPTPKIPNA